MPRERYRSRGRCARRTLPVRRAMTTARRIYNTTYCSIVIAARVYTRKHTAGSSDRMDLKFFFRKSTLDYISDPRPSSRVQHSFCFRKWTELIMGRGVGNVNGKWFLPPPALIYNGTRPRYVLKLYYWTPEVPNGIRTSFGVHVEELTRNYEIILERGFLARHARS